MSTVTLTKDALEATVNDNPIVLIDFWAEWCGPCRTFAPVFESASEKHPDVVFAKVNTEEEPELAMVFQVQSIPTLVAFRDGIGIFRQPGALPGGALDELIGNIKELDMEEVRKAMAEHEQEHGQTG